MGRRLHADDKAALHTVQKVLQNCRFIIARQLCPFTSAPCQTAL